MPLSSINQPRSSSYHVFLHHLIGGPPPISDPDDSSRIGISVPAAVRADVFRAISWVLRCLLLLGICWFSSIRGRVGGCRGRFWGGLESGRGTILDCFGGLRGKGRRVAGFAHSVKRGDEWFEISSGEFAVLFSIGIHGCK